MFVKFRILIKIISQLFHRTLDLFGGEHMSEWFLKMNPQHTVPTLDDNGQYIWESSVICTYLIDKHANDDELYPKDLYQRARCNQRLHFTDAILYQRLRNCSNVIYKGGIEVPKERIDSLCEAYETFENILGADKYLIGDHLTVADLCAISLISCCDLIYAPIESEMYPKLSAWFARMKALPFYDEMEAPHAQSYKQLLEDLKVKNAAN